MPVATRSSSNSAGTERQPKRLILCFDGTGNEFQGNPGDTNIVKLYNMFDRTNAHQMHYYQPGIGTYSPEGAVNVGFFRSIQRKIDTALDQALAWSFSDHVIAGYRFLMEYYDEGDQIYVFGFSRGAFTARFLARMISHIGLLSRGNHELVPFAYKVYQSYEQGKTSSTGEDQSAFMNSFKKHFCRTQRQAAKERGETLTDNESGIKVDFLGLFDCVNSVGTLDVPFFKKPPLPKVNGTARFVRHAVAIDERRVKFKAALFSQERTQVVDDIKEVWFPGNHGDIGGGWSDVSKAKDPGAVTDPANDYFQLSDIALKWMMNELDAAEQSREESRRLAWEPTEKESFLKRFEAHKKEMVDAKMHDTMTMKGGGGSIWMVLLWNAMEWFPFIKRWEFVRDTSAVGGYKWDYIWWPLNKGHTRDIPSTALFHHACLNRFRADKGYLPINDLWIKRNSSAGKVVDDSELAQKQLKDIAAQYKSGDGERVNGVSEVESLTVPVFSYEKELTTASVAASGEASDEWDRIYSVRLG